MSDCGVCIGVGDVDGYAEFTNVKLPKARKQHRCCECRRPIYPGEHYEYVVMKWDGDLCTNKTCEWCAEIRSAFNCGESYEFGALWGLLREMVFPQFNTSCLDRLQASQAKTYLRLKWMEWKGLTA